MILKVTSRQQLKEQQIENDINYERKLLKKAQRERKKKKKAATPRAIMFLMLDS